MRIKFYKKPSVWLLFCLEIACITVCLFFLTNQNGKKVDVTTLNQDNNSNVSNLSENIYTYTVENVQEKHGTAPTLTLDTVEKQFQYSYDVLSSYLPCGSYMEEDGRLICRTMDGLYQYVFEKTDRNTVLLSNSEEIKISVKSEVN